MTKSTVSGRINVRQMVADHNGRHVMQISFECNILPIKEELQYDKKNFGN